MAGLCHFLSVFFFFLNVILRSLGASLLPFLFSYFYFFTNILSKSSVMLLEKLSSKYSFRELSHTAVWSNISTTVEPMLIDYLWVPFIVWVSLHSGHCIFIFWFWQYLIICMCNASDTQIKLLLNSVLTHIFFLHFFFVITNLSLSV